MKRKEIERLRRNLARFTNEALELSRQESINHTYENKAQDKTMEYHLLEYHLLRIGIIDTILFSRMQTMREGRRIRSSTEPILQETIKEQQ